MEAILAENIYGVKGKVFLYELIRAQKIINSDGVKIDEIKEKNNAKQIEGWVISLGDEGKYHGVMLPLEKKKGSRKKHYLDMDNALHSCYEHTDGGVDYCHHILAFYGYIVLNSERIMQDFNLTDVQIVSRFKPVPEYMIKLFDATKRLDANSRDEVFRKFLERKQPLNTLKR